MNKSTLQIFINANRLREENIQFDYIVCIIQIFIFCDKLSILECKCTIYIFKCAFKKASFFAACILTVPTKGLDVTRIRADSRYTSPFGSA